MYRTILVPLDGSTFSEYALGLASAVARPSGADLLLVRVHWPSVVGEGVVHVGAPDRQAWQEERAYLDGVARRLGAAGVRAVPRVLDGPVPETLLEYAVAEGVDLVVMTTHGRGPFSRFWLGSVADQLVQRLPVPVLLARPPGGVPAAAPGPPPRHFLIALDGSPRAEEILAPAVELGKATGASCTLLRVVEPPPVYGVDVLAYAPAGTDLALLDRLRADARDYLEKAAASLRRDGLEVQTVVATGPRPAVAILEEAGRRGCDLIALETRGRRGLPRLFLGSVADKVVRGAAVSVLVHRSVAR